MPPQSCPTRSTGSPKASTSVMSHPRYSSAVHPNPAGTGAPKPGGDRVVASTRSSSARSGPQTAAVSGVEWAGSRRQPAWRSTVRSPPRRQGLATLFVGTEGYFCPSLDSSHDEEGYNIWFDLEGFATIIEADTSPAA